MRSYILDCSIMKSTSNTKSVQLAKAADYASYVLGVIFVVLPFHAFLTITIANISGSYDLLRLWKEAVLLLLAPLAALLVWKTPGLWQRLRSGWLFWAMATYALLHVCLGFAALLKGQVNTYALVYAWTINLRPLLIFIIAFAVAARSSWLRDNWHKLLLWPAVAVVAFGLLQLFALPIDFLQRFGYDIGTIMPFETVDEKLDYIRIQSTLRGANPLGAYIVLILAGLAVLLLRQSQKDAEDASNEAVGAKLEQKEGRQITGVTFFSACLIVLMATYSRSAYIGALLAVLASVWFVLHGRKARQRLAVGLVVFAIVAGGAAAIFRENDRFENTFFHTDENSASPMSSNESRTSALQSGLHDVMSEPFGRGPGTAGPASQHNVYPERIAENYYLQIGQEVGWVGLGLFITINLLISKELWRRRSDALARTLLAALVGVAFINLLQHAWADDTLALIWWGLAGVAVTLAVPMKAGEKSARIRQEEKTA